MAKKLNKNLVLGLAVLGFAITTAAGVAMVKFLQRADPTEFAAKADAYAKSENSEDWLRAYQYYTRAHRTSDDPKYLVMAADMFRKLGKEGDALKMYKTAVVIAPELLEAQEKILDLQLEISKMSPGSTETWLDVKATAQAILDLEGQGSHGRALYGMGAALMGLKEQSPENESLGVEYLEKAVAANPTAIEPVERMVQYLYTKDRNDQAGQMLEKVVAACTTPGKDAADARSLLADYYTRVADFERAAQMFTQAQEMAGNDKELQSEVHARAGRFWATRWSILDEVQGEQRAAQAEIDAARENAIAASEKAIEVYAQGFDGYFLRAEIYRRMEDVPQAIVTLKRRLDLPFAREGFKSFITRANRYALLIALADLNAALASREPRGSENVEKFASQARMYIEDAMGEFHERPEASHSRGKLAYVLGEYSEAVKWFERSDEQSLRSNTVNLHYLALSRLQLGQLGGALEAIQRAATIPGAGPGVLATYAQILQRTGRSREAVDAANSALRLDPGNNEALMARAAAYEVLKEPERVLKDLQQVSQDRPDFVAAQARFLASQNKQTEAIDLLRAALDKRPAEPQLVATAAQIYASMKRPEEARAIIDAALQIKPEDFDLRLAKLQHSDLDEAARREAYTALVGTLPDEYDRAVRLASIYGSEDNSADLRKQLELASDLIVKQATPSARQAGERALRSILDHLIETYTKTEDFAALDKLVETAAAWNDGAGLDGAEGLSYRGRRVLIDGFIASNKSAEAARNNDLQESKRLTDVAQENYLKAINTLQQALDKFPSSGETYAQLGEAFLQTNRLAEARAAMEKSNSLLPRNPAVLKRLAFISQRLNDDANFRSWLAQCKEIAPTDPWVVEQSVTLEEESNPRAGIARREELKKSNPDDLQNLAALARLYAKIGDAAKAEECVDAMLAAKDATQYLPQIADLLGEVGKPDRAMTLLEQHKREAPDDRKADAQLLIAEHLAEAKNPKADAAFLAAADIDPNETVCLAIGQHFLRTGRPLLADEWFVKAFTLAQNAKSLRLPVIYQIRIDTALRADRLDEARSLCAEFKKAFPDDPAGIFLESEILSTAGEVQNAINTLNRYLERSQGDNDGNLADYRHKVALYRRAQLNRSRGNWQEVINDLVALVSADPTALDFKPRLLLSAAYDKVGRADAAVLELESVYREHPEATQVVQQLVDRYIADQRFGEADQVLATMLSRDPENPVWLVRSGDVAVKQNDRTKALANYKLAAKMAGYTPATTNKFFESCREFKVPEQGIEFFETSIPPGQQSPEVILGYGRLLAARGDTARAVDMCRLALYRRGFGSFDFLSDLAVSIVKMMGADAVAKFEVAPTEQVFERANQHILALLLQFNGKAAEAEKIDQTLLESSTDAAEQSHILFRRGLAQAQGKDDAAARQAYEGALDKNDSNLAALNNLAYLLAESADEQERKQAVVYAKRAVTVAAETGSSASTVVDTLDTLGWALICNGDALGAIAKLNQALDINPDYVPATYHLGEAYRRNSQFDEAIQKFQEVIKTPPGSNFDSYVEQAREGLRQAEERQAG